MRKPLPDPTLPVDAEARRLAKRLLRTARSGALATFDAQSGMPFASLVATATDMDGSPILLTSALSAHTQLLEAEPRCSLLVSAIGKGDPLAHPRLTLLARARRLPREHPETGRVARRYLAHHPKSALYMDFPDFGLWRLDIMSASLNGGFGRAYRMQPDDILSNMAGLDALAAIEAEAIAHMNEDHAEAVSLYATRLCAAEPGDWTLIAIDPEGLQLAAGDRIVRLEFPEPLRTADALRPTLIALARTAREPAP
jgi:putative heme iron utilization protein